MPPKRVPLKGEPNFTTMSDERLKEFMYEMEDLRFAYEHFDENKAKVIKEIWKDLNTEYSSRLIASPHQEISCEEEPVAQKLHCVKPKKVKRIKSLK